MAFDFPAAPAVGDTYTQGGGPKYKWDGTTWNVDSTPSAMTDYVLKAGDTMTGALSLPAAMPTSATHAAHKAYVDTKGAIISDTPPASPVAGQLWYESDAGLLWIYYADATSSQWVEL